LVCPVVSPGFFPLTYKVKACDVAVSTVVAVDVVQPVIYDEGIIALPVNGTDSASSVNSDISIALQDGTALFTGNDKKNPAKVVDKSAKEGAGAAPF